LRHSGLPLVRDRPAAFTTQPISREFDEAGVKRDRRRFEDYSLRVSRPIEFAQKTLKMRPLAPAT
jgi:hypothetical protein